MTEHSLTRNPVVILVMALLVLLALYVPLIQTIPSGADQYYMIDVGETQIVLNVWGTLHMTGYPLYVISGNLLVGLLRALGVSAVVAPALVSLLWGMVALALIFALALHVTGRLYVSALATVLFGLTRTVWIHFDIAEIYTFGLVFLVLLLLIALWRRPIRGRIYWLALVGGIAVGHHRAIVMVAPALLYAVWPELTARPRRIPRILGISLLLGLLGLVPYLYMLLRAQAGAAWVYGDPSTLQGLWEQFSGSEASRFIGLPETRFDLWANFSLINTVLRRELTLPGIAVGLGGLIWGLRDARFKRAAVTMLLSGAVAYGFHVMFYSDVLSALILPVTLSLVFGWLFIGARLRDLAAEGQARPLLRNAFLLWMALLVGLGALLACSNWPFIRDLVRDESALRTVKLVEQVPDDATLMLGWGVHYFAVKFAQDVDPSYASDRLQTIPVVDHRADFHRILAEGRLVTPSYNFYNHPVGWWEAWLGQPVYVRAVAPYLVEIDTEPERLADAPDAFAALDTSIDCASDEVVLNVTWYTPEQPAEDLSVFVHAWSADGALIGQGDQSAPVYGLRPLTSWQAGEAVRDVYPVAVNPAQVSLLRYGLYHVVDGNFVNTYEAELPVSCVAG